MIVVTGIVIIALCIFWLPRLASETASLNPEYSHLKYPILFGIYLTTIPFIAALSQGIKLLDVIKSEESFTEKSVVSFKKIQFYAIAIGSIYLLGMIYLISEKALHPGLALIGIVIMLVTTVIAVFAAMLKELTRDVLSIKFENELTI